MKKIALQTLCLSILCALVLTAAQSQAQDENTTETKTVITRSFPGVTTFMTPSGRLGFFEQGTGKIFIYDANLEDCVFKGRLDKLGEPIIQDEGTEKSNTKSYE